MKWNTGDLYILFWSQLTYEINTSPLVGSNFKFDNRNIIHADVTRIWYFEMSHSASLSFQQKFGILEIKMMLLRLLSVVRYPKFINFFAINLRKKENTCGRIFYRLNILIIFEKLQDSLSVWIRFSHLRPCEEGVFNFQVHVLWGSKNSLRTKDLITKFIFSNQGSM